MRIWTIGHSTRAIDEFISLLKENEIKLLADVRAWPGSKRYPQFNKDALAESLNAHGIRYEHFPELGGKRKSKPDSRNTAWRNASFRGYADYMETEQFQKGVERLLELASGNRIDRDHVRGSGLVALSSLANRGLPESARDGSDAHSRRKQSRAASVHIGGADCERRIELRSRFAVVGRFCETPALKLASGTDALQFVSSWVGHTAKEQTDAAGHVLDRVNKWAIDFHFDRRRGR